MPRRPTAPPPPALPADVRLTNAAAAAVAVLAALVLAAAAVTALTRLPIFRLRVIELDGELARSNVATLRANALPQLSGNFFSIDLAAARAAFEAAPWVRQAVVRRVWPDRLVVTLREYRAAAIWEGEAGADRLVDADGDVFEANVGDVEDEGLPSFAGPEGSAPRMLAMSRSLGPVFARLDAAPRRLVLSGRGSWRLELVNGTVLELGRGSLGGEAAEVLARSERFVRTAAELRGRFEQRQIVYADLRHADGYAVRLQGLATTPAGPAPKQAAPTAARTAARTGAPTAAPTAAPTRTR